jgi:hypothetical protein
MSIQEPDAAHGLGPHQEHWIPVDMPPPPPAVIRNERRTAVLKDTGARKRLGDGLGTLGFEIVDIAALLKLVDEQANDVQSGLGDLRGSASEIERALTAATAAVAEVAEAATGSVDHARDSMDRMQAASGTANALPNGSARSGSASPRSRTGLKRSKAAPHASATSPPRSASSPSTPASSPPARANTARVSPWSPKRSANWRSRPRT